MALEDTITEWLHGRGSQHLTVELARELASESKSGWFINAHGNAYIIGKFAVVKWTPHHIIRKEDGDILTFQNVEAARSFLQTELKVIAPLVFDFR